MVLLPWYAKMGAKLVLAHLPIPHGVWFRLGVFRHGQMQDFEYARGVFASHLKIAGMGSVAANAGKVALELGPGESLFTAVLARANGFSGSILVDVGDFALPRPEAYLELAGRLRAGGAALPDLSACGDIPSLLGCLDSRYLTRGLESLRFLPDRSVDFVFSQAVLEHVRRREFAPTLKEIRRILKPDGVSTHVIDLKDHLQLSLNNLRFREPFWESDFVASSGFYTNRLRYDELMALFAAAGFEAQVVSTKTWPELPVPKRRLASHYRSMPDESLRISELTVRLR